MADEPLGEDTPSDAPRNPNLCPPWKPGQSGNPKGRPKGARSKLSEAFFDALAADFAEHGIKAIQDMRAERPQDYAKMIASLQSKEITGEDGEAINLGAVIFKGLNDGDD
jgi:hypothetical protein